MEKLEGTMVILRANLMHTERNFLHSLYNLRVPFQNEFVFIVNRVFHCHGNDKHRTHCSHKFFFVCMCVRVLV
jgi:hypothetical protein